MHFVPLQINVEGIVKTSVFRCKNQQKNFNDKRPLSVAAIQNHQLFNSDLGGSVEEKN